MPSKHALSMLKLDEISLVDNPANPGARVAVWKRGDPMADKAIYGDMTDEEKRKMRDMMDKGMSEDDAMKSVMRMRKEAGESGETDHDQEDNMDVSELEKKLGELESQVAALSKANASLEKAATEAGYDVTKADDGSIKVEKKAEAEYIDIDGEKVLKSDVPAPLLKRIEKQAADLADLRKRQEMEDLRKRADEEIPNLKGTPDERGALLKAVDGIADEAVRKSVKEALKAADASVKAVFAEVGKSAADDESSATFKLNKMAEDYAKEHKTSFEVGFSEVTKSGEGRKLLVESESEN